MKILDMLPVNYPIIEEEAQYLEEPLHRKTGGGGTVAEHLRIWQGKPSIESSFDEVLNTEYVYHTVRGVQCDACFIDCFGDPGVGAARCSVDFPVFGGFEPAVLIAMSLADRIGIITVLENVQPILREHIHNAHLERRIVSVRNVNIPVLGLEDHNLLIEHLTEQALEAVKLESVEAFVLGCTGMLSVAQALESNLARAGYTVPVIEPGQASMVMCELAANLGCRHSRKAFPREKE